MIRKLKKTLKKDKGDKVKLERLQFIDALKNGKPGPVVIDHTADEILKKIRERGGIKPYSPKKNISPYDTGPDGAMGTLLNKLRKRAGLK
jgi:hypothetical protein